MLAVMRRFVCFDVAQFLFSIITIKKYSMKKVFLISSLIMIFSCQKKIDEKVSDSVDLLGSKVKSQSLDIKKNLETVDGIKLEYNLVNAQLTSKKLDSASFEYECDERSGNVVYYSEKGKLKVVKYFQADSHFSSTETYFVDEGKPYFIFQDETVWSFDGGLPDKPITKDDVTEKRYYIVDNKAIQCLEKKYTLKSNSENNPKSENIPNKEMKNCSIVDLQKNFDLLMKNKNQKGTIKCL